MPPVQPTPPPPESGTAVLDKLKAEAAKIGATVEISALSDGELLGQRVRLPRGYHWKDGHSWEGHGPKFAFGGSQHWQEKCARLIAELARDERCRDDTCE